MRRKIRLAHKFDYVICLENLLAAWQEFTYDKSKKCDVQEFKLRLMDNLILLHRDLAIGAYRHSGYHAFNICDPKPRSIHKAIVRDRIVHHAIYNILYPFFDRTFIADSYSCRLEKGTHKAVNRFRQFARQAGRNNSRTCWILKGDIRKFFANIDHNILKRILTEYIPDKLILNLLDEVIDSFSCNAINPGPCFRENGDSSKGLPLGNLTSQLLVNIYMNKFDQFVKHKLKIKYYIRYADDFVILSDNRNVLVSQIRLISDYLAQELKLTLHPDKLFIKTLNSGLDFLGWVNFFHHRILRTSTKKRMFRKITANPKPDVIHSYLGMLSHGNGRKLSVRIAELAEN